ncbi:hypothetical protein BLA29_004290 [Euroglyphus maynei]|uniref:Uncharacterized protein n=1 Tax=Euroglyphus maynei TaxID=6958 RepID=A0A1Y3B1W9_EURMA|nr:hypothetical protein BLA29_004290 [Euroglyphus maynei]
MVRLYMIIRFYINWDTISKKVILSPYFMIMLNYVSISIINQSNMKYVT